MRRLILAAGSAALLALGACSTLGQPTTFDLAELTQRCESRGGALRPTGAETGRAQVDNICHERANLSPGAGRIQAARQLGQATHDALQRGGPYTGTGN